jgi:hypothetical protein
MNITIPGNADVADFITSKPKPYTDKILDTFSQFEKLQRNPLEGLKAYQGDFDQLQKKYGKFTLEFKDS